MKKSTFEAIRNYLNGDDTVDLSVIRDEVNAEWEREHNKAQAKADAYEEARTIVMTVLRALTIPVTVKELFEACAGRLPEDFTANKLNYALRNYWVDEVVKHTGGKTNTYTAK